MSSDQYYASKKSAKTAALTHLKACGFGRGSIVKFKSVKSGTAGWSHAAGLMDADGEVVFCNRSFLFDPSVIP